jgi:competence protein ComEA
LAKSPGRPVKSCKIRLFLILTGLAVLLSMLARFCFPGADMAPAVAAAGSTTESVPGDHGTADGTSPAATRDLIPVYLVGAVVRPGIYTVERGCYLYELVEMAGGLTADAAAEDINLACRLDDNQRIRLPTKAEVQADSSLNPDLPVDPASALVDINRADASQLETLPGIGPATAKTIISYREKTGGFKKIEDLMKITGIKESRFNAIKDQITIK